MSDEIEIMITKLRALEDEIETAIEAKKQKFFDEIEEGKAKFSKATIKSQQALKLGINKYFFQSNVATILSAPFIYAMIIPFVIMDISLFFYQTICFSAWRVTKVKRSEYIIIDRHRLAYLNILEKLNCMYCSYGNGLVSYMREISSRTEQYWCPIKHALKIKNPHERYNKFVEYGDAETYRRSSAQLREELRKIEK